MTVPLADAAALRPLAQRTRLERFLLVAVLVALVAAVALAARRPDLRAQPFVPKGSDGLVVLDLSASISPDTYARIGSTLNALADTGGRYGLVIFSDVAYEALPPGSPAQELRAFARYFTPSGQTNPWTVSFSSGTRISRGLTLAREIAARERLRRPAVVLVSDLDDDPQDLGPLRATALAAHREGLRIGVVGLNADPEDERFFRRLVDAPDALRDAPPPGARPARAGARFPATLGVLAALLAVALAAHELRRARLSWRAT
jgi:hypothetical protein